MTDETPAAEKVQEEEIFERWTVEREAVGGMVVDDKLVNTANQVLKFLSDRYDLTKYWVDTVEKTLPHDMATRTIGLVEARQNTFHFNGNIGAIPTGTGIIRQNLNIEAEPAQAALQLLKLTGRIVQGGVGRGRCIVVVSDEPLHPATFNVVEATALNTVTTTKFEEQKADVLDLIDQLGKSIAQERGELMAKVEAAKASNDTTVWKQRAVELTAEVASLKRQNDELRVRMASKDDYIKSLEQSLAERQVSSWL